MEWNKSSKNGRKITFSGVIVMSVDIRGQNIDKMTTNKMCALSLLLSFYHFPLLLRFKLKLLQAMWLFFPEQHS